MHPSISELAREPIGSSECKYDQEEHLQFCRESLGTSYSSYIHIVIDHPDEPDTHECEYDEIGLFSIPETISETDSHDL